MLAVYTLTRDRLEYTKRMFNQLKNCGIKFDHYVLDNGSTDGTPQWLEKQNVHLILNDHNAGIWLGISKLLEETDNFKHYDLVIKIDNDIEFPQDNWLRDLVDIYNKNKFDLLQPFIEGIQNGKGGAKRLGQENGISKVDNCAGGCLITKREMYDIEIPQNKPKAQGWDCWFGQNRKCGLVEEIHVKHDTITQERDMPEYYKRKVEEARC